MDGVISKPIVSVPRGGRTIATVKEQLVLLLHPSVAVTCTVFVVPSAKELPEGGVETTVTGLQESPAVTDQVTISLVLHVTITMLLGQVIVGGMVSTTVTVCVQSVVLVQQSVACQVRLMICGQTPEVELLMTVIVTLVPQHASVAEGGSKVQAVPHCTVLLVAQVRTGGVVSTIVTVCAQVARLVQQSTASQVRCTITEQPFPLVIVFNTLMVTLVPQQASNAVGGSKLQLEPH